MGSSTKWDVDERKMPSKWPGILRPYPDDPEEIIYDPEEDLYLK